MGIILKKSYSAECDICGRINAVNFDTRSELIQILGESEWLTQEKTICPSCKTRLYRSSEMWIETFGNILLQLDSSEIEFDDTHGLISESIYLADKFDKRDDIDWFETDFYEELDNFVDEYKKKIYDNGIDNTKQGD